MINQSKRWKALWCYSQSASCVVGVIIRLVLHKSSSYCCIKRREINELNIGNHHNSRVQSVCNKFLMFLVSGLSFRHVVTV